MCFSSLNSYINVLQSLVGSIELLMSIFPNVEREFQLLKTLHVLTGVFHFVQLYAQKYLVNTLKTSDIIQYYTIPYIHTYHSH